MKLKHLAQACEFLEGLDGTPEGQNFLKKFVSADEDCRAALKVCRSRRQEIAVPTEQLPTAQSLQNWLDCVRGLTFDALTAAESVETPAAAMLQTQAEIEALLKLRQKQEAERKETLQSFAKLDEQIAGLEQQTVYYDAVRTVLRRRLNIFDV